MENIKNINRKIAGLKIEAIEEKGNCWVYADDPSAEYLFGYKDNRFSDDIGLYFSGFEIRKSAQKSDAYWVVLYLIDSLL